MTNMNKTAFSLALLALAGAGTAQAQDEQGRVISTTPVVQQFVVPRQVCQEQVVTVPGQKSGAGALMGGIAGGAMGNAVGDGSGRALATMLGVIGGAVLGNNIEGSVPDRTETVQQCSTQNFYENRTVAYTVVYEYAGRQYTTQMPYDPGRFVRLSVTPVIEAPTPSRPVPHSRRQSAPAQVGTVYDQAPRVAQVAHPNPWPTEPRHAHRDNWNGEQWIRHHQP
jgi:uncharacterized protein YcfJ